MNLYEKEYKFNWPTDLTHTKTDRNESMIYQLHGINYFYFIDECRLNDNNWNNEVMYSKY